MTVFIMHDRRLTYFNYFHVSRNKTSVKVMLFWMIGGAFKLLGGNAV